MVLIAMSPIGTTGANAMTLQAHYTNGSKARPATLDLATCTDDGHRAWIAIGLKVAGKAEARKIAKLHNATPWNF
jgi:hypothetical protein